MYHRFPTRAALCAELWIRTEERFQSGFVDALDATGDTVTRGVAAALFTLQWCRDHDDEARVLLVGADALDRPAWPEYVRTRRSALRRTLNRALARLDVEPERLRAAVVDVPYAIARRHLVARQTIPSSADAIVEDCVRALLAEVSDR